MDLTRQITSELESSAEIMRQLSAQSCRLIAETAEILINCLKAGSKIMICGNGGSAADAQHFAAEMIGRLQRDRAPLPAIALSTDTSILTALSNDYAFADVFAKQIQALGQAGDVLVGLSTSGNSENVLHAISSAHEKGMKAIGMTGMAGGALSRQADYVIQVPSLVSQRIQEGHIAVIHVWCALIEDALFPQ